MRILWKRYFYEAFHLHIALFMLMKITIFHIIEGILATGGISGAHLNPAVTLSMAILKKCKWIQVPVYMIAQYVGAFTASAVLYGNYYKFMG